MAFDRLHAAFYANSFTLASFCVCLWEDVSKNGGVFDVLNYSWGGSILQVVLAGDFDFSSQNHMKCPAQLQVLFAVLLLVFSLCLAACSPHLLCFGTWGEISTFKLSARRWRWHTVLSGDDAFCLLPCPSWVNPGSSSR